MTWRGRLGFGAGDLAQNLLVSAVGTYLLFFSTDVIGLAPSAVATMFLAVQLADALWNPFAGVFIDRHHPPWGKYRSYLLLAGIPFALFAVLCFAHPLGNAGGAWKTLYAYAAYAGFTLLFTFVNVAYGALSASLTRDTEEITVLTAVRIFLANAGCLVAMAGVPLLVAALGGADGGGTPSLPGADGEWDGGHAGRVPLPWRMAVFMGCGMLPSFVFMPLLPALRRALGKKGLFYVFGAVAVVGMAALYVLSRAGGTRSCASAWIYAAQFVKATGIIVATGYMWALVPEVIEYSERLTGRRVSGVISAIVGVFFRVGMALGNVTAGLVLSWTGYQAAQGGTRSVASADILPTDPRAWLWTMLALAGVAAVLFVFSFTQTKERVVMDAADAAQVKFADLGREFRRNGPLRWLALFFVAAFALMSVGNAAGAYFMNGLESQTPLAQEGIRWLVCVVPSALMAVAAFAISRYRV
ncbi:MAG: MFS transporter [Kiritimatiellae bacterium]|nr:MFS transporter [Kiritimatiellia bacterium]